MSSESDPRIGILNRAFGAELAAIEMQGGHQSPDDRVEILLTRLQKVAMTLDGALGSYLCAAGGDAHYLAYGAQSFLESTHGITGPNATQIIRRSSGLLLPAHLPSEPWEEVKQIWSEESGPGKHIVPPTKLELQGDGDLTVIEFTAGIRADMLSYASDRYGCPAKGIVLDRFFAKYVDVMFAPTIPPDASVQ